VISLINISDCDKYCLTQQCVLSATCVFSSKKVDVPTFNFQFTIFALITSVSHIIIFSQVEHGIMSHRTPIATIEVLTASRWDSSWFSSVGSWPRYLH